jgi:uncharacterized protein (DUF1778 family)
MPGVVNRPAAYPDRVQFRVSPEVREALDRAARLSRCTAPEYARRVMLAGLDAMGVQLPAAEA